jgi:hypothetical protein
VKTKIALALLCVLPSVRRLVAQAPQSTVRVSGYVQPRFQAIGDSASFLLRRARVAVEGNITPWARARIQVEFRTWVTPAAGSSPAVQATDLYLALSQHRWTGTFGQFRVPLLRENLMSSTVLELADRTLGSDLIAPFRDIGAMAAWTDGRVAVAVAITNGEGANVAKNRDNKFMYAERATVVLGRGLDLGVAAEEQTDTSRWTADGEWKQGRLLARGGYLRLHRRVTQTNATAWYGLAGYAVRPERLQVVARVESYDPSDAVGGDATMAYTAGAQVLFKGDDLKLQASYGIYHEQGPQIKNNRLVVQMQARF